MNNPNSKLGRTPQDKINRHVAFALNNPPADNLSLEVLQTLANWYKELQGINILPLEHEYWQYGLCHLCMLVPIELTWANKLKLINLRLSFFKSWPKYSGIALFPIPDGLDDFKTRPPGFLELRKELSLHCIAELENLEHRIKILKILKRLYRLPATNDSWGIGLCYTICNSFPFDELSKEMDLRLNYLKQHFKTWKHFSGITHEPIPKNGTYPRKQLRKNLCGHVIKSIKEELKYVL